MAQRDRERMSPMNDSNIHSPVHPVLPWEDHTYAWIPSTSGLDYITSRFESRRARDSLATEPQSRLLSSPTSIGPIHCTEESESPLGYAPASYQSPGSRLASVQYGIVKFDEAFANAKNPTRSFWDYHQSKNVVMKREPLRHRSAETPISKHQSLPLLQRLPGPKRSPAQSPKSPDKPSAKLLMQPLSLLTDLTEHHGTCSRTSQSLESNLCLLESNPSCDRDSNTPTIKVFPCADDQLGNTEYEVGRSFSSFMKRGESSGLSIPCSRKSSGSVTDSLSVSECSSLGSESADDDVSEYWGEFADSSQHPLFPQRTQIVERLLAEYKACGGVHHRASTQGPSVGNPSQGGSAPERQASKKGKRKMPHGDDEAEDGDDDHERNKKRANTDVQTDDAVFACPFFKKDPLRYECCQRFRLRRIRDVKQHLRRRHMRPIYCPFCGIAFDNEEDRDMHTRQMLCDTQEFAIDGLTHNQREQLSEKGSSRAKKSPEEQWYSVFDIVFPGHPRPSSPYIDPSLTVREEHLREFMLRRAPDLFLELLDGDGRVLGVNSDRAFVRRLIRMGQERLMSEYFSTYSSLLVSGPSATTSRQEIASSDSDLLEAGQATPLSSSQQPSLAGPPQSSTMVSNTADEATPALEDFEQPFTAGITDSFNFGTVYPGATELDTAGLDMTGSDMTGFEDWQLGDDEVFDNASS